MPNVKVQDERTRLLARIEQLEAELAKAKTDRESSSDSGSNTLLRLMLNNLPDLVWAKDVENRYLFANREICSKLLKCQDSAEAFGNTDIFFAERERNQGQQHTFGEICVDSDTIVKETGKPGRFIEYGLVQGENLVLDVYKAPFFDEDGNLIGTVGCGRDITGQREAKRFFREAARSFRKIADDVEGIAVQGYNERREVTLWNKESEQLYGYSKKEAMGRRLEDLIIPKGMEDEVVRLHRRWLDYNEKIPSGELVLKNKNGEDVPVYSSHTLQSTLKGREMFCIDVNLAPIKQAEKEKSDLSEQLEKARRLEAIGTLAGGVAHDFNNILAAISGYAELASTILKEGELAGRYIDSILQASWRAKELVRQILLFSRSSSQEKTILRLREIVQESLQMMRSSLPSSVEIQVDLGSDRDIVYADSTALHQMVINLCTNAYHAMKYGRGSLKIGLRERELKEGDFLPEEVAKPGMYLELRVEDSGEGMSEKTRKMIFEPYFTTKERGKGTGLGLATVHGVVREHEGYIRVDTVLGSGTTFYILLPQCDERTAGEKKALRSKVTGGQTPSGYPRGNEKVLVVDDEPAICSINRDFLSGLGYEVTTCICSLDALTIFSENPFNFDLLVTDQTMPKLTGVELIGKVRQIRADLPCILCTGFVGNETEEKAQALGVARILEKPVRKKTLVQCVRMVLDG